MMNFLIHDFTMYCKGDQIKEDNMDNTYGTHQIKEDNMDDTYGTHQIKEYNMDDTYGTHGSDVQSKFW